MKKFRILLLIICFVIPCALSGCEIQSKDTLSTPQNLTVETGGIVTFVEVSEADYYVIDINGTEIKVNSSGNTYVERYSIDGVSYFEYNASRVFTLGKSYSIKVKAVADGMRDSAYSETQSYTHTMPISTVENCFVNGTTLTWDEVTNADYYVVKVVSPTDGIVADDCESVAVNSDLTSYRFSTNRFDFSKILNTVGEYKFYVNAVSSNSYYSESGYIVAGSYSYTQTLSTPSGNIHKVNEWDESSSAYVDNWHLLVVVDSNSNKIVVELDGVEIDFEIVETSYMTIENNILDINLNLMFKDYSVDLTQVGQHALTCYSASTNAYYLTSSRTEEIAFEVTKTLSAPVLSISLDNSSGGYVVGWTGESGAYDTAFVSQFLVYIFTEDGLTVKTAENTATSVLLTSDFVGVSVQAVGVGSYLSSSLSGVVTHLSQEISSSLKLNVSGTNISWTALAGAYYLVEIEGEIYDYQTDPSCFENETIFNLSSLSSYPEKFIVYYILKDYVPYKLSANLSISQQLFTPTNLAFNSSSNPYLLTFNGVDNAIGYYVYINGTRCNRLFTVTTIDLSNYISTEGDYTTYSVRVMAVADKYSEFSDSELSSAVDVEHTKTLSSPEFYSENGSYSPVKKETDGGETKYYLMFYGVDGADSYTVMINFNAHTVQADTRNSSSYLYTVEITAYISGAGNYEIMVRALSTSEYINSSDYNSYEYSLTQQLDTVTGVVVTSNDGVYTLSFDLQVNAYSYSVRIVKLNDSNYADYLLNLGLKNTFTVDSACIITDYLQQAGEYYIYVTAVAKENGYYSNSDESSAVVVSKLETLDTPSSFEYNDKSASELYISWTGDSNADYYIVVVTDPNGYSDEYKTSSNTTQININDSFTIEGDYSIKIKSVVGANSVASATYQSSAFSDAETLNYTYLLSYDFERYQVYLAGNYYDNYIESASDLIGILWYQYLYGVDENYGLRLYIVLTDADTSSAGSSTASERNAILRLATEAKSAGYFDFSTDETWISYSGETATATNSTMFAYLCKKLIELYPYGTATLLSDSVTCVNGTGSNIFKLYYKNAFLGDKEAINFIDEDVKSDLLIILNRYLNYSIKDYANDYTYLSDYSRRSSNTTFAIDQNQSLDVTTTEQLLMAVQYGKKPNFVGDSALAEEVYSNAKAVLVAIVNDKMTDLEKVEAIFDWLTYAFNVNLYANYTYTGTTVVVGSDLSDYGNRAMYYLEGIFYGLTNSSYAGSDDAYYDGEFYFGYSCGWATSESLAQAFTLLCAIEGIETRVVNGSYTTSSGNVISHSWNKVYLDVSSNDSGKVWYNVDLMFSDGVYDFSTIGSSYYATSHKYFLVSDSFVSANIGASANSLSESISASSSYNYYTNTALELSYDEIYSILFSGNSTYFPADGVSYTLQYDATTDYHEYLYENQLNSYQAYLLNILIYGKYLSVNNESNLATIEFKISSNVSSVVSELYNNISRINQNYSRLGSISLDTYSSITDSEGYTTYVLIISFTPVS